MQSTIFMEVISIMWAWIIAVSYTHLVAHIRERQPREGAEHVEVAVQFLFGVFQFPLHQQADLDVYKRQAWYALR